jgi:hypothetical protein
MLAGQGLYNGVANANVAFNWQVSDVNGVTVTPSFTTDDEGYIAQRLTFSGTAGSGGADIYFQLRGVAGGAYVDPSPGAGKFNFEAKLNATALTGLREIIAGGGAAGAGITISTGGQRLPALTKNMFFASRSPAQISEQSSWNASVGIGFLAGAVSGTLDISRFGIFLEP